MPFLTFPSKHYNVFKSWDHSLNQVTILFPQSSENWLLIITHSLSSYENISIKSWEYFLLNRHYEVLKMEYIIHSLTSNENISYSIVAIKFLKWNNEFFIKPWEHFHQVMITFSSYQILIIFPPSSEDWFYSILKTFRCLSSCENISIKLWEHFLQVIRIYSLIH